MTTSTVTTPINLAEAGPRFRPGTTQLPALALGLGYLALASAGALSVSAKWLVALVLACAAGFACCAAAAARQRLLLSTSNVVLWAVVFRAPFVFAQPVLSDDVWRYLWDGKLAASGIDPYAYAPDAPEVAIYRDDVWSRVNHRSIPTVYPPAAQILFRIAASHGGLVTWKLMCVGFDLVVIAALAAPLRRRPAGAARLLLYAWNPLVIVEFAWSGHVDAAAIALCTLAIVAARKRHDRTALALASVAAGIKLFPALLLPMLVRRARTCASWAIPLAVAATGVAPYLSPGAAASLDGLRTYARTWEFNSVPYALLTQVEPDPLRARSILAAILMIAVLVVTVRRREPEDAAVAILAACVALSPTVHPWYVTWALPAAVLSDRLPRLASLTATVAVLMSYAVLMTRETTGAWSLPRLWLGLEWGVVAAVFAGEWIIHLRRTPWARAIRCGDVERRPGRPHPPG